MARGNRLTFNEEKWQLDEDVRALARAAAIKADPDRYAKVKKHAKTMKEEIKRNQQRMKDGIAENNAILEMAESK